ncbi:RsmE family RNA methyltransferase [Proteocatella sphenisci]|uniref:RsmE family RNA methyltransferase n=1 Tax=Proteocatella sphenisci TaxID=181070 RepID=UPI00048CDE07|nr:RsmE family RNA methyltransferase [Proteocatella sphenisci]
MDRFFADSCIENRAYITDTDEIKHITKVMRLRSGDKVELIASNKKEFIAQIREIKKDEIILDIVDEMIKKRELDCRITIYQGIPKGQKMELIIQKSTELGVARIVPCQLKRCVSNISEKEDKKISRWQKIAQEASKQSKRIMVPVIENTMGIDEIIEDMKTNQINILFYESEENLMIKDYIRKINNSGEKIISAGIIIGPEGGLEESECFLLSESGAKTVSLGDRILRTETAAIYGATVLAYEFE